MEFDTYSPSLYNDSAELDDEDFYEILDNPKDYDSESSIETC